MSSLRLSAAVIASAAAVVLSALPAQADPSSTPDADDIVGVGSDTTQFLLNDLANGYNATSPTPVRKLASFDAVHPTSGAVHDTITARTGVSITRPNGSSEGIVELTKVGSTVDFARSSRAEKSSDDTTSSPNTVFIPFAVDELRWMVNTDAGVPLTLTAADLRDIYTCASTNWVDFGGANKTIVPLVPQAGGDLGARMLAAFRHLLETRPHGAAILVGSDIPLLSADHLAEAAGTRPFRLIRAFKRQHGLPPHAYLTQLRVRRARDMIAAGCPPALAAAEVGFADQSHLNRHFKRILGITPGRYGRHS